MKKLKYFGSIIIIVLVFFYLGYREGRSDISNLPVKNSSQDSLIQELYTQFKVSFDTSFRDPFISLLPRPVVIPDPVVDTTPKAPPPPPEPEILPPNFTVQTILWGSNPVVIVASGNQTELLKKGDSFQEFIIKEITSDKVIFSKKNKRFTLSPP